MGLWFGLWFISIPNNKSLQSFTEQDWRKVFIKNWENNFCVLGPVNEEENQKTNIQPFQEPYIAKILRFNMLDVCKFQTNCPTVRKKPVNFASDSLAFKHDLY